MDFSFQLCYLMLSTFPAINFLLEINVFFFFFLIFLKVLPMPSCMERRENFESCLTLDIATNTHDQSVFLQRREAVSPLDLEK